jgi:hypothetical protein
LRVQVGAKGKSSQTKEKNKNNKRSEGHNCKTTTQIRKSKSNNIKGIIKKGNIVIIHPPKKGFQKKKKI